MKATIESTEQNKVTLQIEVEADKFQEAMDKAYNKVVKKVNVPGFRKGKVPRAILERHYGKHILFDEALDIIIPEAYLAAVKETGIEPIDRPEVDVIQVEDDKPVIFKAVVEVKPEVKLGQYTGLEVTKEVAEIGDEQIADELKKMQERHAKVTTLDEGNVEMGDVAIIDFKGFLEDVAFPGGEGQNHPLEIGSNQFIPGFEEQLIGAAIGEEKVVNVPFPEDYHSADLAGKAATFNVKINSIRRKETLPVDDEFAKDVSEFDTLEELKADILNRLKKTAEEEALLSVKNLVINKAVENSEVEVPAVMVETKIDQMVNGMNQKLRMQGLSVEDYCRITNTGVDQLRAQMRPDAETRVKGDLVLEAIAKAENIQATDEDVEKEFVKMAEQYKQPTEDIKKWFEAQGNLESFKQDLAIEKTIDFLVESAKIA